MVANSALGQLKGEFFTFLSLPGPARFDNLLSRDMFGRLQATQLRIDGAVHYRESAGTGPVVFKVVPVTVATFSGITMDAYNIEKKPTIVTVMLYTYCERSELLIRQVYQFELGCIKKIAH